MTQSISMRAAAIIFTIAGGAAYLAPLTTEQVPQNPDPVTASFERDLNHESGPATRIRRESVEHDELYEALNRVHWTRDAPSTIAEPAQPIPTEGETNEDAYD